MIKLHYSFYLFLFLTLFTSKYLELLVLVVSIVLHECGHIIVAKFYGINHFKLEITFFGGVCHFDQEIKHKIIYLSGILVNLILIIVFIFIKHKLNLITNISTIFIKFNLVMALFSMIPIYPLDGYWIIKNVFIRDFKLFSKILVFFAIFLSVYYREVSFLILFLYLLYKNYNYQKEELYRKLFSKWSCIKNRFSV